MAHDDTDTDETPEAAALRELSDYIDASTDKKLKMLFKSFLVEGLNDERVMANAKAEAKAQSEADLREQLAEARRDKAFMQNLLTDKGPGGGELED